MKIALQWQLLPQGTLGDRAKWAKDHGAEGIELTAFAMPLAEMPALADQITRHLPVTSVCGNKTAAGERGFDFLHPDPARRRASIEGSKAFLKFCGEVGAVGQIVPPIFGPPVVPDLAPVISIDELEDKLMVAALKELGPFAAEHNTLFLAEPLNRYEQHYLRRQSDGVRVIEQAAVPGVKLLSDLFHMHIEETNTPEALRQAGKHVGHLHLADNTRQEPGTGDIDFVAAFKALRDIGFQGYMAYECSISGDTPDARAKALAKSIDYVRSCIDQASR